MKDNHYFDLPIEINAGTLCLTIYIACLHWEVSLSKEYIHQKRDKRKIQKS